jgi:hypothetical protein
MSPNGWPRLICDLTKQLINKSASVISPITEKSAMKKNEEDERAVPLPKVELASSEKETKMIRF